jgi:branched-chain amino acid transport system substrate-binding protein
LKTFFLFVFAGMSLVLVLSLLVNYSHRSNSIQHQRQRRAAIASKATGDISVGVVWPNAPSDMFLQGVQLAVDEVNRSGGVPISREDEVTRRKIRIHVVHEGEDPDESPYVIAERVTADFDVVAVIGHSSSALAIPASIVYERAGVLFVAPVATSPDLTQRGFQYVLRTTPDDKGFAEALSRSLAEIGAKTVAILFVRNKYGENFSLLFRQAAETQGIKIISRQSYSHAQSDFRAIIASLRNEQFDAVFIADEVPRAAVLIRQLRDMGVREVIAGGDGLDSPVLWEVAGEAANDTLVASVFDYSMVTNGNSMAGHFVAAFTERHDTPPNLLAAQGYEAVKLLAEGFKESRTTVPSAVSTTMRFTGEWEALFGKSSFSIDGDIIGKQVFVKKVENGMFVPFK